MSWRVTMLLAFEDIDDISEPDVSDVPSGCLSDAVDAAEPLRPGPTSTWCR